MNENNQVQAPAAPPQVKPSNYMTGAILSTVLGIFPTIFCFILPVGIGLGIVAIVKATRVDKLWFSGQHQEAEQASKSAKTWLIWSVVGNAIQILIGVVCIAVVIIAGQSRI